MNPLTSLPQSIQAHASSHPHYYSCGHFISSHSGAWGIGGVENLSIISIPLVTNGAAHPSTRWAVGSPLCQAATQVSSHFSASAFLLIWYVLFTYSGGEPLAGNRAGSSLSPCGCISTRLSSSEQGFFISTQSSGLFAKGSCLFCPVSEGSFSLRP